MKTAVLRSTYELVRDGWTNVLSGFGGSADKSAKNRFAFSPLVHRLELAALYESEGLVARIVDIVAEDMTRAGWSLHGDEKGTLAKAAKDLELGPKVTQALKWVRLFGGALIVLDIQDGKPWDQPYDPKSGKPVRALKVYSAARVIITSSDFSNDTQSNWFEEVERFTIKRLYGPTFQVHASRCIILKGRPIPDTNELSGYDLEQRYWGVSVLQSMHAAVANFGVFMQGISHLGQELTVGKYTISNLEQLVAEGNWKALRTRMGIIEEQKSSIHAVLLGDTEKYERDSLTFTGVPDVIDRLMMVVSAHSDGIPVSRLFGRGSTGLNSNGEGDGRDYYDMIANKQVSYLEGPLLRLYRAINAGIGSPVKDTELGLDFKPVWSPSMSELITMRKTVMETDKGYVDMGVLDGEQIFNNRFSKGYTTEYQIEGPYVEPEDPEVEDLKNTLLKNAQKGALPGTPAAKATKPTPGKPR